MQKETNYRKIAHFYYFTPIKVNLLIHLTQT
jgi:hypothetical protein